MQITWGKYLDWKYWYYISKFHSKFLSFTTFNIITTDQFIQIFDQFYFGSLHSINDGTLAYSEPLINIRRVENRAKSKVFRSHQENSLNIFAKLIKLKFRAGTVLSDSRPLSASSLIFMTRISTERHTRPHIKAV